METIIKICSLASGSNGNAYYIEADNQAILIDVGITYRQLKNRAKSRGIDMRNIKAIFVTHEHSDHVRGLRVLSQNFSFDTYMTRGTANKCREYYLPMQPAKCIGYDEVVTIGKIKIYCFEKSHDVEEPCSYRVEIDGISIGVFTDIGCTCEKLQQHLEKCHVAFLESNYDEQMLREGKYPQYLKQRIFSDKGHLSNMQAAEIVEHVNPPHLHTLILSHLSAENNHPRLAMKAFERFEGKYKIMTASRYEAGELLNVDDKGCYSKPKLIVIPERLDRPSCVIK